MRAYVIRRILLVIPTLFIVTVLVFLSVRFIPGDIIDVMTARMTATQSGTIDEEALKRRLGLDNPSTRNTRSGSATSSCVAPSAARCTAARWAAPRWNRNSPAGSG